MSLGCAWAWVRAHQLHWTLVAAMVLATLSALWGADEVTVPVIGGLVQLSLILAVGPALLVTVPLQNPIGELIDSLPRRHLDRLLTVLASTALALAALSPLAVGSRTRESWPLVLWLTALAVVAVVAFGELAWLVAMMTSMAAFYADRVRVEQPVQAMADRLGLSAAMTFCAACVVLFVWRGPRRRVG